MDENDGIHILRLTRVTPYGHDDASVGKVRKLQGLKIAVKPSEEFPKGGPAHYWGLQIVKRATG